MAERVIWVVVSLLFLLAILQALALNVLPRLSVKLLGRRQSELALAVSRICLFLNGIAGNRTRAPMQQMVAHLLLMSKDYPAALKEYTKIAGGEGGSEPVNALVICGDCHMAMGGRSQAEETWRQAESRAVSLPDSFEKFQALMKLAGRKRDLKSECSYAEASLPYCTGIRAGMRPIILASLISSLNLLHQPAEAKTWALKLISENPPFLQMYLAYSQAGLASLLLKDLDGAHTYYCQALEEAQKQKDATRVDKARAMLARVELYRGHVLKAVAELESVGDAGRDISAIMSLAHAYSQQGRIDKALEIAHSVVDHPEERVWTQNSERLFGVLAISVAGWHARQGAQSIAAEYLKRAETIDKEPGFRSYYTAAKALVAALGGNVSGAARYAHDLAPRLSEIEDTVTAGRVFALMSETLLLIGEPAQAGEILDQWHSSRMFPSELPRYYLFLGRCAEQRGDRDSALGSYRKAVEYGPEIVDGARARERLDELAKQQAA